MEEVFEASDGQIVGRIRLQKIFYLLEQLGVNSGLRFSYHHYGPYSEALSQKLVMAELVDGIVSEKIETTNFNTTYSIYSLVNRSGDLVQSVGDLPIKTARPALAAMKAPTSVVIELAATIHWLKHKERVEDWNSEIKNRKPGKATDSNILLATKLLSDLGLS